MTATTPIGRMAQMGAAFAGSNLARMAIGFATSIIIGRGLGLDAFGRWTLLAAYASTLTLAFELGLGTLVTRESARMESGAGRLVATAVAARLLVFAPVGAAIYVFAPWISDRVGLASASRVIVWLAAAGMAYGCLGAVFRSRPRWLLGILAIETIGAALQCAGAAWVLGRGRGVIALLWLAVGVQVLQIVAALALWRIVAAADPLACSWRSMWPLVRRAFPFALSGFITNAQVAIAPLMLGSLAAPADVAWFGVASRIGGAVRLIPNAGFAAALPVLSAELARDHAASVRARFDGVLRWFAIVAAVGLGACAAPVVRLTYGDRFAGASTALMWMAAGLLPSLVNSGRKIYMLASDRERGVAGWTAATFGIQAAACLAFIPVFGAAGAAAAITAGEAVVWWPLRAASGVTPPARDRRDRTVPQSSPHRA